MTNFDAECLADIERRRNAGFAPSDHERYFLIRLAHEALGAREELEKLCEQIRQRLRHAKGKT